MKKITFVTIAVTILTVAMIGFIVHRNQQNVRRRQNDLAQVTIDNWDARNLEYGDLPFDLFLDMPYLIEFLNNRPTRTDILNMSLPLQENENSLTLFREGQHEREESFTIDDDTIGTLWRIPRHSLTIYFHPYSEELTHLTIGYLRYFDGLDFEELRALELETIAGIFRERYNVFVRVHAGGVWFDYQGFEFYVRGETISVRVGE